MRRKLSRVCIVLGLVLLAAAAALSVWLLYENSSAAGSSEQMVQKITDAVTPAASVQEDTAPSRRELPDYVLDPTRPMPTIAVDGHDCIGVLEIPALEKTLPVIAQWDFDVLRDAPCRYDGSAYDGSLIIAAHNYVAHFGSLSSLQGGENVVFTDADGNVFSYVVTEVLTITPDAVEELYTGTWDLTLFTCTFGNTYRTVVRCRALTNTFGT